MQCSKMISMVGVVLLVAAVQAAKDSGDKPKMAPVPVTVYYESLCPDSVKFVTKQVYPAFKTFGPKSMDLTLVPYGKSKHVKNETGGYVFDCHHGPNECFGNKVQACALHYLSSIEDKVEFVNCVMDSVKLDKKDTPDKYPGKKCADKLSLSYSDIQTCSNGTDGDEDLAKMGDKTHTFQNKLESVPTVVFNNMPYNKKENEKAQKDFAGVLCSYLGGPTAHKECKNSAVANQATILFAVVAAIFVKIVS